MGQGAEAFTANVRNGKPGSTIQIRLDAPNGELIGMIDASSGKDWTEKQCQIKQRDGIHDLYFVFGGDGSVLMQFDYWQFK